MNNEKTKKLCLALLNADSEDEVIKILQDAGYWDDPKLWRLFGDQETNFSTIGNQQSRPEAALVEKVVNCVDARLMNECQIRSVHPESPEAPQSIRAAVARFFEGTEIEGEVGGKIRAWDNKKRREIAHGITVAVTGARIDKGNPCFTISDIGEGQTPNDMPKTLLSIGKKNKQRIPFVQGKFNMGGTGVLRFCSKKRNLQFMLSRRNPAIIKAMGEKDISADYWGFTIIRREDPHGIEKNSVYTYLAPINADKEAHHGNVLQFTAKSLPLMPELNEAYKRKIEWGTAIKLYEYQARGFKGNAILPDGLTYRLDLLLPEIALPLRLHECRQGFRGKPGSFDHNLNGLLVRLEDDRQTNLEDGFPDTEQFELEGGEKFTSRIYAFKRKRAKTYRKNEAIIFTINGQTHGYLPLSFFNRTKLKKIRRLGNSILVIVDATKMTRRAQEDLFPNSRDRLSSADFRASLEEELVEILSNHAGLRMLSEKRKREETEEKLADSQPLENILASIIKKSPTLSALFAIGPRLTNPNKPKEVEAGERPFEGQIHPTFFRFKKLEYGKILKRNCPINRRCRILFETDVRNDYFDRVENPGKFSLIMQDGTGSEKPVVHNLNLRNGAASLNIKLPPETRINEILKFRATIMDDIILEPFINEARVTISPEAEVGKAKPVPRKPPSDRDGKGAESQLGIDIPEIDKVKKERWHLFDFNQYSACAIRSDESESDPDREVYEFHVNVDNSYLQMEMKESMEDARILEAQFIYGVVLVGLALIKDRIEQEKNKATDTPENVEYDDEEESIEQQVTQVTRALSPFILPMIKSLAAIEEPDVAVLSHIGDDE